MNTIDLHNKTLPVVFARGYLHNFICVSGRSVTLAYFQGAAHQMIPDREARDRWLLPLYAYLRATPHGPQPLDYRYVSLIEQGLRNTYAPKWQYAAKVTKEVGKQWWALLPPAHPFLDEMKLQHLFALDILLHLNELKHLSQDALIPAKTSKDLVYAGFSFFMELLSNRSGITYRITQRLSKIVIHIDDCPFCLNQSEYCHVSTGILEGFLEWLHGKHQPEEIKTVLRINESLSSSHTIILDSL
jgi:hypothetical protein